MEYKKTEWVKIPNSGFVNEDTYVFSDIHGQARYLEIMLSHMDESKRKIFLGDVGDRGPQPIRCFELLKEAKTINIRGNHDLFLENILTPKKRQDGMMLLLINGGVTLALDIFSNIPKFKKIHKDFSNITSSVERKKFYNEYVMKNNDLLEYFYDVYNHIPKVVQEHLNSMVDYVYENNIVFTHAGIYDKNFPVETTLAKAEDIRNFDYSLCWARECFIYGDIPLKNENGEDVFVIHGHTISKDLTFFKKRVGIDLGAVKYDTTCFLEIKKNMMRGHIFKF